MSSALDLLNDACVGLPHRSKKMFGGYGFFAPNDGMFAGIVDEDRIILKLDDEKARAELIDEGGHAWTYGGQAKPMTMKSWIVVPEHFYDDTEALHTWAKRAHRLAPAKKVVEKKKAPPVKKKAPAKKKTKK